MAGWDNILMVPDQWQRDAVNALREGKDVIVDAPTGAGKTLVFEVFVSSRFRGQAIYTVPTRALANDKLTEWTARRWRVGISTGDVSYDLDAPVVVATLETQRQSLLRGEGPDLLVIDEYQMLNDPLRGLTYEMAVASAPSATQLLLLSGSVGNPEIALQWLRRLGREAVLIRCRHRPVPLEEVDLTQLKIKLPSGVAGVWPRAVARALAGGYGPLLVFAPHRREAEDLARQLAAGLPPGIPLELTPAQQRLARGPLRRMLRARVAYHHSGLDYLQRAGLVEPLAKAGQLRVVVATTGLGAGINFSTRSVIITGADYRFGAQKRRIRPDELLQMFGRAGRRGMDEVGYVLTLPETPKLREAAALKLVENRQIDWQACLALLRLASQRSDSTARVLDSLNQRLLSGGRLDLGLHTVRHLSLPTASGRPGRRITSDRIQEMLTPAGQWERLGRKRRVCLREAQVHNGRRWLPALAHPEVLRSLTVGSLCRLPGRPAKTFGRLVTVASFPHKEGHKNLDLSRWFHRALQRHAAESGGSRVPPHASLERLEEEWLPLLPALSGGGTVDRWEEYQGTVRVYLDYGEATVFAYLDSAGAALIGPPLRERPAEVLELFGDLPGATEGTNRRRPAAHWFQLGLIDRQFRPTRRGVIFSFFHQGEGLAIAAALENASMDAGELIFLLANLRAGHRFAGLPDTDTRIGDCCRLAYGWQTIDGYLRQGLPTEYGEGAAEVIQQLLNGREADAIATEDFHAGDIERVFVEWRSLLRQIAHSPDYEWDRWRELKAAVLAHPNLLRRSGLPGELPLLPIHQQGRVEFGKPETLSG